MQQCLFSAAVGTGLSLRPMLQESKLTDLGKQFQRLQGKRQPLDVYLLQMSELLEKPHPDATPADNAAGDGGILPASN